MVRWPFALVPLVVPPGPRGLLPPADVTVVVTDLRGVTRVRFHRGISARCRRGGRYVCLAELGPSLVAELGSSLVIFRTPGREEVVGWLTRFAWLDRMGSVRLDVRNFVGSTVHEPSVTAGVS